MKTLPLVTCHSNTQATLNGKIVASYQIYSVQVKQVRKIFLAIFQNRVLKMPYIHQGVSNNKKYR